ncbi:MAG: hypothetical protein V4850_31300 [Myxococcota bacterium]
MILLLLLSALVPAALARDVDLKVHDMKGAVTGEVTVELSEPGQPGVTFVCKDDGLAPDGVAGDRLYTARAAGLALDHGTVVVRSGAATWQGGFRFDDDSDPVLLIGLEEGGFAAASTREVMFVPQDRMAPGSAGGPPGGGMSGAPGGHPEGGGGPGEAGRSTPGTAPGGPNQEPLARKATGRAGTPEGMWMGWALAAAALGGLGAVVWAGRGRAPRLAPLVGVPPFATTAGRGAFVAVDARTDLFLGPGAGARIGDGRWTPDEIVLAALRVHGPVRVVVTDPSRLEVDGDGYPALAQALTGIADLFWVDAPS